MEALGQADDRLQECQSQLSVCSPGCLPNPCPPVVHTAALDQWERELRLYTALRQLKIFRMYKLWKSFRIWKKAVNQAKFTAAKASLEKNLFLLSPVFQVQGAWESWYH